MDPARNKTNQYEPDSKFMNLNRFIGLGKDCCYPDGTTLTHSEFCNKIIEKLGGLNIIIPFIPFTLVEIVDALEKDKHLNTLSVEKWDAAAGFRFEYGKYNLIHHLGIAQLYQRMKINSFSCSDGVSLLKSAARLWAERETSSQLIKNILEVDVDGLNGINHYTVKAICNMKQVDGRGTFATVETNIIDKFDYTWDEIEKAGGIAVVNKCIRKQYDIEQ